MITVDLAASDDFEAWRIQARRLVSRGCRPEHVAWRDAGEGAGDLFAPTNGEAGEGAPAGGRRAEVRGSRAFVEAAKKAILHRDPARLALLYRLLWRLQEQSGLMEDRSDPDVHALARLCGQVRRDIHKMRAFVRFRLMREEGGVQRYVAWFEPDHRIERANVRFFIERFASQRWSILTPRLSLHWDGETLREGPSASRADAPSHDATEDLWLGYYRSIFNPARLKVAAMAREMPRRYWKNLPEARAIPELVAGAQAREVAMIAMGADHEAAPRPRSLAELAGGVADCRRCPIGCNGTRAVMGQGPAPARLMILGEQPGDNEEVQGLPFVGPAGQLLDTQLSQAGIARKDAYVTNAVKHFKFSLRGKRRLHQSPTAGEIDHCRWWLESERALVRPGAILALGASAGRALLGRTPSIGRERGKMVALADGTPAWLTVHPSYLLRLDGEARQRETRAFQEDLRGLARALGAIAAP